MPSTSDARCHRLGSLSANGQLAGDDSRCVAGERGEHALHGEAVLVEIFGGGGEGEGRGLVGLGIHSASDAAREHARADRAVIDPHQRLGARAEQAVDREGPGVGIAEREVDEHAAQIGALGQVPDQIAGEHHLAELAVADAAHRLGDRGLVAGGVEGPGMQRDAVLGAERPVLGLEGGSIDPGDPAHPVPAADDDLGNDQHAHRLRLVGEGEGAEGDEPRSREPHLVADRRGGGDLAPARSRHRGCGSGRGTRAAAPRRIRRSPRPGARTSAAPAGRAAG